MAPVALKERHGLLERLARIHRSVSDGAPLEDVLTAVAAGAADLLGDPVAGLRVLVAGGSGRTTLAATAGLTAEQAWAVREGFVAEGAGGRAIAEDRLIAVEDHDGVVDDIAAFLEGRRQSALAAPVRAGGRVVGSLTVAAPDPSRRYGSLEQEILSALAEHAGLALLDAGALPPEEPEPEAAADETAPGEPAPPPPDGRLRQTQALEAAGILAGHVAAELQHQLSVVLGHAAALEAKVSEPGTQEDIGGLVAAAERGAALVHRLGQFGRRDDGEPEVVDLGAASVAAARQARRTAPADVELDVRPGSRPVQVRIDPGKLQQALGHLADNALAAGGQVTVAVDEVALDGADPALPALPAGRYARLTVADTGSGMAPGVLARALEPGFTTQPRGSGAGLGLSLAHRIVQRAGGHLAIESVPGTGTTVTVLLPLAQEAPVAAPPAPAVVVLAEDPAMRGAVRGVLEAAGHSTLATRDPDEALTVAQRSSIRLVLVDDALPGTCGIDLADRFADVAPHAAVIVMSAYVAELAAPDDDGVGWLQKPFDAAALMAAVAAYVTPE